jgi:hypothetical protein
VPPKPSGGTPSVSYPPPSSRLLPSFSPAPRAPLGVRLLAVAPAPMPPRATGTPAFSRIGAATAFGPRSSRLGRTRSSRARSRPGLESGVDAKARMEPTSGCRSVWRASQAGRATSTTKSRGRVAARPSTSWKKRSRAASAAASPCWSSAAARTGGGSGWTAGPHPSRFTCRGRRDAGSRSPLPRPGTRGLACATASPSASTRSRWRRVVAARGQASAEAPGSRTGATGSRVARRPSSLPARS